ncbi:hypothetical protein LTR95_000676 [Oleoguttula sp. CCFEE 5521]
MTSVPASTEGWTVVSDCEMPLNVESTFTEPPEVQNDTHSTFGEIQTDSAGDWMVISGQEASLDFELAPAIRTQSQVDAPGLPSEPEAEFTGEHSDICSGQNLPDNVEATVNQISPPSDVSAVPVQKQAVLEDSPSSTSITLPYNAHTLSTQAPGPSTKRVFKFTDQGIVVPGGRGEYFTFRVPNWEGPDHKPQCLRELLNMHWIKRNLHKATAIVEYLLSYPMVRLSADSRQDLENQIDAAVPPVTWDSETLSLLSDIILFDPGHCTSRHKHTHIELAETCQQNALHVFEPGLALPYMDSWARDMREWRKYVDKLLRNPSKMTRFPVFPIRGSIICGGSNSVAESQICYGAKHSPLGICDARVMFCFESVPDLDLKAEYKRWDWRHFLDCPEAVRKDFVKKATRVYDVLHMMKLRSAVGVKIRDRDVLLEEAKAQQAVGLPNHRVIERHFAKHILWARRLMDSAMYRERGLVLDPKTGVTKFIA